MKINNIYYHTRSVMDYVMALLYPEDQTCCICGNFIKAGTGAHSICISCYRFWVDERQTKNSCPRCGFFRGSGNCQGPCQSGLRSLEFIIAAAPHDGVYRQLIQEFKYNGRKELAEPLGFLMAEALSLVLQEMGRPWLVPVPMYKSKENQRGYNQSTLLAHWISYLFGLKVKHLLIRTQPGKTQAELKMIERWSNLMQAFSLNPSIKLKPGQPILIVDDVVTTGATLLACNQVIHQACQAKVAAVCFTAGSKKQSKISAKPASFPMEKIVL